MLAFGPPLALGFSDRAFHAQQLFANDHDGKDASMTANSRQCGECSLCCKAVAVRELDKPAGQWCRHFSRGARCTIYDERPGSCRVFNCHWLLDQTMGDEWYPKHCKMVVQAGKTALLVHVDPGAREPWRKEPYLSKLTAIANQLIEQGRMVVVLERGHSILVLPDRIVDLGVLEAQDEIGLAQVNTPQGPQWMARLVKRDGGQQWVSGPIVYAKNFAGA
jgi:hypothetical protein